MDATTTRDIRQAHVDVINKILDLNKEINTLRRLRSKDNGVLTGPAFTELRETIQPTINLLELFADKKKED